MMSLRIFAYDAGSLTGSLGFCVVHGIMMDSEIDRIKERLLRLDEEIAETMRRLPAHSVKPPVMMDLLQLEDERDQLLQILKDRR